jgi:hypothetical protein
MPVSNENAKAMKLVPIRLRWTKAGEDGNQLEVEAVDCEWFREEA